MKHSIFEKSLSYNFQRLFRDGYNHIAINGERWSLSLKDRALVGGLARALNLRKYLARVLLKNKLAARCNAGAIMQDGYALCDGEKIPGVIEALTVCDRKLDTYLKFKAGRDDFLEQFNPAKYQRELAKADRDPVKHVPYRHDKAAAIALIRPFLQPEMYLTAADYLGLLPVLTSVRIAYSPNEDVGGLRSSQFFHADPEGERQVKVFIAVHEVGPQNSPLTFIPDALTQKLMSSEPIFLERRLKDEKLAKRVPRSEWVSHMGPPGRTVFLDTSRCFHFGSRPAAQPRLLLYAQYLDPFCSLFAAAERPRRKLAGTYSFYETEDPIEQYLLGRR